MKKRLQTNSSLFEFFILIFLLWVSILYLNGCTLTPKAWQDREADIGDELKFAMDMPQGSKKFVYVTFSANADGFTPISAQTQRLEFKGFFSSTAEGSRLD